MRAAGLIVSLILAGVAACGAADAAIPKAPKTPPPVADTSAVAGANTIGLRGAVAITPTLLPAASSKSSTTRLAASRLIAQLPPLAPPRSLIGDAALGDTDKGQCRMACAHAYYLCSAGGDSGDCPGNWSVCLAGCSPSARPLPSVAE